MAEETCFLFRLVGVEELLASSLATCFCSSLFVSVCFAMGPLFWVV